MPKIDIGVIHVEQDGELTAVFRNKKGTSFQLPAEKLDGYLLVEGEQGVDFIAWLVKTMNVIKAELYKKN